MIKQLFSISIIISLLTTIGCSVSTDLKSNQNTSNITNPDTGISTNIPNGLGNIYNSKNFNRYTRVLSPNGGSIHIVAQNKLTDEQIIRCRSILQHFLKNYENSKYGSDKSSIANKMAENKAILCLLNGQDDGSNPIGDKVTGQPLYQNEIQVEGHSWYMHQNYEHRDATFEEILHFVHDYGIGVDYNGTPSPIGAAPDFQAEIRAAQKNALTKKLWGINSSSWIQELKTENSLSQEYLAAIIDSYYGLWGAWEKSNTHGMWGIYISKTRFDISIKDPLGYTLMNNKFFHPYLTYNARIDANLNGNFSLKFDPTKPYTHHSRYLKDITLLGVNNNTITINELDNNITGNTGINTVLFSGASTEYSIKTNNNITTVIDNVANRDGKNILRSIEKIGFTNTIIELQKTK
ncbi:hypothetical protein [Tenacibaculum sp. 190524A02b]|uniref:hypothetical protein n=1 Tax=Tenacibaculum vairaonense TaxID=3137860 RepID=UPI0031FB42F1